MKRTLKACILACMLLFTQIISAEESVKREVLLRLPLLSEKNARIVTDALNSINGIEKIEACYELRVLMIAYDSEKLSKDIDLVGIINNLNINTVAEKIYESDIPIIKAKYKITELYTKKEKERN